jgi:low temperature requirement protein LtrA
MQRLISPWEYRHLRGSGATRVAAGGFQLGIGLVLLSLGRQAETDQERRKMYRLSAWFLVPAALNLAGGYWYLVIASSPAART